jgi:hypothetical protein
MKALINSKNEVVAVADDFEQSAHQVAVLTNGSIDFCYADLNLATTTVVDLNTITSCPADLDTPRKYILSNGAFIANPRYMPPAVVSINNLASTIESPKAVEEINVQAKTATVVENWLALDQAGLITLPADLKDGLNLLLEDSSTLTADQLAHQKLAINWKLKLNARFNIEAQVGDVYDLIADQAKRISLLARLLMRLGSQILTGTAMAPAYATAYETLITEYLAGVDSGTIFDRSDLEDPDKMFTTLTARDITIANIVKSEYSSKIVS